MEFNPDQPRDDLRHAPEALANYPGFKGAEYCLQQDEKQNLFQWYSRTAVRWWPCGEPFTIANQS